MISSDLGWLFYPIVLNDQFLTGFERTVAAGELF
jgi:hypothetical protein